MEFHPLLQKTENFIHEYFRQEVQQPLAYHNLSHTESVVKAATQIANHYQLADLDFFIVSVSAWFHDMGYYVDGGSNHEAKGASMAAGFLEQNAVEPATIEQVINCILATRLPQQPVTLNEKIVCDADLFHLGTDDFAARDKLMRKECEASFHREIGKKEWRTGTIRLFQTHHYHTDYCQLLLNQKKQENLDRLLKKQKEKDADKPFNAATGSPAPSSPDHEEVLKEKKIERPVRGIETMFRVASTNHQRLSDMADSKANIIISVNSIIISVVLSLLLRKLETAHNLIVPTMLLLGGSVAAIIFSILATRPKIPGGYFSEQQLSDRKINLLFFGNFYKMDFEHYYDGMKQVMADSDFLYASLIRDIHSQGIVLGHKYKLLRISYTVFMFTLIISVLAFGIALFFLDKAAV